MMSISKKMYIDKLDEIVNKYNNTYHGIIKMKPGDVNPSMYIDFNKGNYQEGPNFKVDHYVRISKHKNTVPGAYNTSNLKGTDSYGTFYEKELQKTNQKQFRFEKVIKRKSDTRYVKWKGCDNSFNSWIDKKYVV